MLHPRFSMMVRLGAVIFDYALIVALAALGSLWWLAVSLGLDPHPGHIVRDYEGLAVVAAGVAAWFFWRATRGRAIRKGWRVAGVAVIAGAGALGWLHARAFILRLNETRDMEAGTHQLVVQGGAFLIALVLLFALRHRALARGWLTGPVRAVLAVVLVGYLTYLHEDEPPAPVIARNQAALAGGCDDEATYRLTLRYTPAPGGGQVFVEPPHKLDWPQQGEKQRVYLLAHRAEIEADWAGMTEVRAWWAEMAAQPQLGDRTERDIDQPLMRFSPVAAYMRHALAIACLRALDGDGDGALAMVGDVYKVGARLEPSSRTLLRTMVAKAVQRSSLEAAGFVLDHATVSAEARRSFARLLAEPAGGRAGARRLVLTESAGFFQSARGIATFSTLSARLPSRESWPLYIERCANTLILKITLNPQATANRLNEAMEECAFSAETRELGGLGGMEEKLDADLFGHFQIKNLAGRLLIPMAVPGSYTGVVRTYWETEDRRAALLKRLGGPPAATFTYSLPEGTCRAEAGV